MVNGESVAQSEINDSDEPSNLSILYRGKIPEDAEVALVVMAAAETTIEPKHLQYGYKLYGEGYNLIDTPD